MENDVIHQQKLLWELFKVWVNNHDRPDNSIQAFEINNLYEKLSKYISNDNKAELYHSNKPGPMLGIIDTDFPGVIQFIINVIEPEKICCLAQQAEANGYNFADLLIVIPESYHQSFPEIETVINFTFLKYYNLSATLIKSSFFDQMIRDGHVYYSLACKPENLVYDNGKHKLPKLKVSNFEEKVRQTNLVFLKWMSKANAFLNCAESTRKINPPMTAFMLHQASELSLRALTKTITGQERTTHSIKNLLLFSQRITTKLSLLMGNGGEEDERLMSILEAAYLGFRYGDYQIEESDLDTWFERTRLLQHHSSEVFSTWMAQYDLLIKTTQNAQEN